MFYPFLQCRDLLENGLSTQDDVMKADEQIEMSGKNEEKKPEMTEGIDEEGNELPKNVILNSISFPISPSRPDDELEVKADTRGAVEAREREEFGTEVKEVEMKLAPPFSPSDEFVLSTSRNRPLQQHQFQPQERFFSAFSQSGIQRGSAITRMKSYDQHPSLMIQQQRAAGMKRLDKIAVAATETGIVKKPLNDEENVTFSEKDDEDGDKGENEDGVQIMEMVELNTVTSNSRDEKNKEEKKSEDEGVYYDKEYYTSYDHQMRMEAIRRLCKERGVKCVPRKLANIPSTFTSDTIDQMSITDRVSHRPDLNSLRRGNKPSDSCGKRNATSVIPLSPIELALLQMIYSKEATELDEKERRLLDILLRRFKKGGFVTVEGLNMKEIRPIDYLVDHQWDGRSPVVELAEEPGDGRNLDDLPEYFSLLSKLNIGENKIAKKVLAEAEERKFAVFEERKVTPVTPQCPTLIPYRGFSVTPLIIIEKARDAHCWKLRETLRSSPIVVVRGIATSLKLDTDVFSTRSLVEAASNQMMEIRVQMRQKVDENVDENGKNGWRCWSEKKANASVKECAEYQDKDYRKAINETIQRLEHVAKRRKMNEEGTPDLIKFGTNFDITRHSMFDKQNAVLDQFPAAVRLQDSSDLLSLVGYDIPGMNRAQAYLKVDGNRTPAHIENNAVASVNYNVGPGDCVWLVVPYEYYEAVKEEAKKQKVDLLKDSYWTDAKKLLAKGVPVQRFTQKAGDLVVVGPGCFHWVQSVGWCNNIAWNVMIPTHKQLVISTFQYELNRTEKYMNLVPMQRLFWYIAKKNDTNTCLKLVELWVKKVGKEIEFDEVAVEGFHDCFQCQSEVFGIGFWMEMKKKENSGKKMKTTTGEYSVRQEITFMELTRIYDSFNYTYGREDY